MNIRTHHTNSVDAGGETSSSPVRVCMYLRVEVPVVADGRVMRQASSLVKAGFAVTIVDVSSERSAPREEVIEGIRIKHIAKPRWLTPARMPWKLLLFVEKIFISALVLLRVPTDIYHAHDVNTLSACFIAAMLRRKPLIFDAHELPLNQLDRTRRRWLRAILARLLTSIVTRCSAVITVSPPIAQEICKRYHASKVTVIRNFPAYQVVPKCDRLRQHLDLGPEVRIALYQGNIQVDRRLDTLVRASAFLERDIVVILMGRAADSTKAALNALAIQEGVTDRVKILDPVPYAELLLWTVSADIGLIIYTPDHSLNVQMCLPNKLFEYLMAGLPVLASPLVAVADILNTYEVGQIVPSLAPTDVAAGINAMLKDQTALERMRHNALQAAQHDLCWAQESQQLIRLYTEILAI
jgi:glycosyltransferase involved in cell wall biosynthesis